MDNLHSIMHWGRIWFFFFFFKRTSCSKLVEVVYILCNAWSTYLHVILKSFFSCHPLQQHNWLRFYLNKPAFPEAWVTKQAASNNETSTVLLSWPPYYRCLIVNIASVWHDTHSQFLMHTNTGIQVILFFWSHFNRKDVQLTSCTSVYI